MIKKIIVLFGILFTLGLSTNAFELSDSQILVNPFSSPEIQEYSLKVGKKSSPYPVPGFQEAEEVGVILNMDLSIIKLVKMLSEGGFDRLDINDLQLEPEVQQPSGKKFVNPYELE